MSFWGQKTFCVVAGASRGIGQAIALAFAKKVGPGSVLLLLSRTTTGLEQTKTKILSDPESNCASVVTTSIDLSSPEKSSFASAIQSGFLESSTEPSMFQQFILVQVAASLGIEQGYTVAEIQDIPYMRSFFDFNICSFILLNSVFTAITKGRKTMIVHISSHGAVEPFKTWGLYCAARAAKDMLLRSIALESPNIQTLNYAPGVVDTDNYTEALQHTADPELIKEFEEARTNGTLLTPLQTAETLVEVLHSQKFTKGEHISYSDFHQSKNN